jgi:putative transposase
MGLFHSDADYAAWERVLEETLELTPIRICAYCWMPNHWHLVLWPERDGQLSEFMQRATNRHTQRWQRAKRRVGYGHLYQGRFKSFPIEADEHFYTVCRYVERNALRAGLVRRAENWRWGSLSGWQHRPRNPLLSDWPLPRPSRWVMRVNAGQTEDEVQAIRRCVQRGRPYGSETWTDRMVQKLGLESTVRPRGRPRLAKGSKRPAGQ